MPEGTRTPVRMARLIKASEMDRSFDFEFGEGGSEKHLKVIAGAVELSSEQIDYPLLEEMVKRYALETEWQQVLSLAT